ncbi:MAG: CheY-like receiver [Rhodospirillaceae bacterium]|nr:MAG: CheY-like receiver [Rhodospirillaceae bacterium]
MAAEWEGRLFSRGSEEVVEELRQEFLDELEDNLRELDVSLDATRRGNKPVADLIVEIRKFALPLRGQSANFGVRLLGTVALRFED